MQIFGLFYANIWVVLCKYLGCFMQIFGLFYPNIRAVLCKYLGCFMQIFGLFYANIWAVLSKYSGCFIQIFGQSYPSQMSPLFFACAKNKVTPGLDKIARIFALSQDMSINMESTAQELTGYYPGKGRLGCSLLLGLVWAGLFPGVLSSQNLIANGGFETRNICTEYEATCAPEAWFKIPPAIIPLDKIKGAPANSGDFADMIVVENKLRPFNYRVFMYTMLLCPLEKDTQYVLELYVNPIYETHYEIGVLFSVEELIPGIVNPLPFLPSMVLSDTNEVSPGNQKNWRKIQAVYTAQGGEQFLTLGNFSQTAFRFSKKTKMSNNQGDLEILLDDIKVSPVNNMEGAGCPQYESNRQLLFAADYRHSYRQGVKGKPKSELFVMPEAGTGTEEEEEVDAPEVPTEMRFELPDIAFDFDKYVIKPVFYPALDSFIQQIKTSALREMVITGHTDNRGSDQYNQAISEKRANAVLVYIQQQYPEFVGMMVAIGKGETEPRTDNLTEASRARNRRVEIVVR